MARLPTGGGARTGGRKRKRSAPTTPAFGPLRPAFAPQQDQAHRKTQRAKARLPQRPLPHVPIIHDPTPAQTRAATKRLARGITRQVGSGGSGAQRNARRQAIYDEIASDPRYAQTRRAIAHYTKAAERQTAAQVGKAFGVRGRQAQVRAGRQILAERMARDTVKPGVAPLKLQVAGLGVTPKNLSRAIMGVTSLAGSSAENSLVKKALSDVGALGTAPFVGGYALGKAAIHDVGAGVFSSPAGLLSGKNSELRKFGEGIVKATAHDVTHPGQAFSEHPILSALNFGGLTSIAGRGAGAVARTASRGRVGSTVRSPLATVEDAGAPGLVERSFSKDLGRKQLQKAEDSVRKPLRDSQGNVVTVERGGRKVPVLLSHEGSTARHPLKGERKALLDQRADFAASRANSVERMVRDQADKEMKVRGVRGRNAKDLVSMVVEGTITSAKHFEDDLRAHAARLRAELAHPEQYRDKAELAAAQQRLKLVEQAIANPRVLAQREKIVAAGETIGRTLNETERQAIETGVLHGKRAARSRLVPAAIEHLGARYHSGEEIQRLLDDGAEIGAVGKQALKHGAIRHSDGKFMSNADVESFLKSRGRDPETVAYLPHREMGRGAFHAQFRPGGRPTLDTSKTRTGEAYRRGSTEVSTELIRAQGVRQRIQIAKAQQLDRLVADHGIRHPAVAKAARGEPLTKAERKAVEKGGYFTGREAEELATRVGNDTALQTSKDGVPFILSGSGQRLTPMRAFGAKLDKETQRIIREDLQGPGAMDSLSQRLLNDRFLTDFTDSRARNVVLVPTDLVERLNAHLRPANQVEKFFQFLNRPFRMAVLPQPRWLAGNFIEPYIVRLTAEGSGLNVFGLAVDLAAERKIVRAMERSGDPRVKAAAQEIRAHQEGGLFIGRRGASNRREVSEFLPHAAQQAYGKLVAKMPAVHQMVELTRDLGKLLVKPLEGFFILNRGIESVAQKAALGRSLRRDIQEFTGQWHKTVLLGREVAEEAAKGLTNTAKQERFMRAQHEMLGKYEGFSPMLRSLIQGPFPFLPWALNAARFVYWTMPAHHTALTSLLVRTNDIVAKDWKDAHKPVAGLKGGLQYAIPTRKGGWVDLERYTPYGLTGPIAGGDLGALPGFFVPQSQGLQAALRGQDPFGRPLQVEKTAQNPEGKPSTLEQFLIGLYSTGEAMVPYLSTGRRLQEHGETPYADSTVLRPKTKPGTSHGMSAARRVFDPFRPTYVGGGGTGRASAPRPTGDPEDAAFDAALDSIAAQQAQDAEMDAAFDEALKRLNVP